MLPTQSTFHRIALNRVTFGARDTDVSAAASMGWAAWVNEQLNAPAGDDPALDAHLKAQRLRIVYRAAEADSPGSWPAVDEQRPLNYLGADTATLWNVAVHSGGTVSPAEKLRIVQETAIGHFIRNTHAKYQVREFMADFWNNHFNVCRSESDQVQCMLPLYDRVAIRPHALGNFRAMLEAVASSAAMLFYLDNAESNKTQPNENYARELLELHTLGADAYLGVSSQSSGTGIKVGVDAPGYTDQDVIEASRALSGWTIEYGQRNSTGGRLPSTGKFVYNANQHNTQAGKFLGLDLSGLTVDMQQGRMVLDIAAYHPSTADFVCRKLCRRIFGDAPPEAVVARAKTAWLANTQAPDQIKKVLEAILLDGPEIGEGPALKVRRPYERLIALFRTTDMVLNANANMLSWVSAMGDSLYVWPEPDGRPDDNNFWLTSVAVLGTWNILINAPNTTTTQTTLYTQTPAASLGSAGAIADYWLGRMIGVQPESSTYNAILSSIAGAGGVLPTLASNKTATFEGAFRRLVSLIASTEEFLYR
jgi:uncharacterized protein (DUF1800 family)